MGLLDFAQVVCGNERNLASRSDDLMLARPFKAGEKCDNTLVASATTDMANTFSALFYHIIFSTKNREPWISREIEERIWKYIGGIARNHQMSALQIGGIDDHVHALINARPTFAPCEIAQLLKGESSKWIHNEFPKLRLFSWQDGYGAFTVSKSGVDNVIEYIRNQRVHHQRKTFQEEYLEFLKVYGVEYDPRYVWG
jgi:REP element-mobilizing transposase RayT